MPSLDWLLQHVQHARRPGFELDDAVFQYSQQNMAVLALPIDILNTDFQSGVANLSLAPDQPLIAFIATTPPVTHILNILCDVFAQNPLIFAVQLHESVELWANLCDRLGKAAHHGDKN